MNGFFEVVFGVFLPKLILSNLKAVVLTVLTSSQR